MRRGGDLDEILADLVPGTPVCTRAHQCSATESRCEAAPALRSRWLVSWSNGIRLRSLVLASSPIPASLCASSSPVLSVDVERIDESAAHLDPEVQVWPSGPSGRPDEGDR